MTGGPERLHALDVFRGITIAAMILVSTPGSWDFVYPWLEHAPWNGWTLADLVFPFLLFAMGAAVPFALGRRRGTPRGVRRHVLRRALILFALGLLLNAIQTPPPLHLATFRIPGVLQRIALVYLAVSWITERLPTRAQVLVAVAALGGYWLLLAMAPLSAEANLGAVIDQHVFGRHMLYPLWDPEGLLSTVPAIATALCGVFAGDWLKVHGAAHRAWWLWAAGAAATAVDEFVRLVQRGRRRPSPGDLPLDDRRQEMERLVATVRGIRPKPAGRVLPVGRDRRRPRAMERRRLGFSEGVDLPKRVSVVAAAMLRQRSRGARLCGGVCRAVGRRGHVDAPAPGFHRHLKVSSPL
jgi:uncharacterized membrane protein